MAQQPSIEELREFVARDKDAFAAQKECLERIKATPIEELKPSDRNMLSTWDRSTITEFNRHLSAMENIEKPNREEKTMMQELNKLVNLGDHMVAEAIELAEELHDKLGPVDMRPAPLPQGAKTKKKAVPPSKAPAADTASSDAKSPEQSQSAKQPDEVHPTTGQIPENSNLSLARVPDSDDDDDEDDDEDDDSDEEEGNDDPDPIGIYAALGVDPATSQDDVRKAIKKQKFKLHPDRNTDDPDAADKFADFELMCRSVETPEARGQYGSMLALEDVERRVRSVSFSGA